MSKNVAEWIPITNNDSDIFVEHDRPSRKIYKPLRFEMFYIAVIMHMNECAVGVHEIEFTEKT